MQFSDDPETMQQMLYVHRLIQKRIGYTETRSSLQPLWYRGLSDSQMAAADSLHVALEDDILEGSTYRVHYALHRLGLNPRPAKSGLRRLFPMSRGNDVAFLWFLMETYYMSENHEKLYGCNEQIIMSTIFWLDLYPTLRELDRVLPLPHASAEVRQKEERRKQAENEQLKKTKKRIQSQSKSEQTNNNSILPYFERPSKPKYRHRNFLATAPKRPAILPFVPPEPTNTTLWSRWFGDSNFVPTETANSTLWSRWFGDFNFGDGKRIATTVLQKEIDNILSSLDAAKLNKRRVKSTCLHHKMINEMEHSLRLKLEKIKQEKREQLINVDYRSKERNRRRTLQQLDRLTEYYRGQFHDMAIKTRMSSTRKRLCVEPHDPDFIYVAGDKPRKPCSDWFEEVKLLEGSEPLPLTCLDNMPTSQESKPTCKCSKVNKARHRPSTLMQFLQTGGTEMEKKNGKSSSPPPNQCCSCRKDIKYFVRNGQSYKFNYRKLFASSKSTLLDQSQLRLREKFIKAFDEDVEYLNAVLDGDESGSVDSLVDRSTNRIYQESTDLFQEEYEKLKAENAKKAPEQRLNFGQQYFDADNIDEMKEMLRLGLERVAQDRRYILPTLPNVHSVPLLIKWICARYGKLYSSEERKRDFNKAKFQMNNLMLILRNEIVQRQCRRPTLNPSKLLSTQEQIKMSRLLNLYWTQFMKYFVQSIMELGRVFHSKMQADQGSKSTSTYYAYMPAHIQDIDFIGTTGFDRRKPTKL